MKRDCQSYITHKHHKDNLFEQVNILIVLKPSKPPIEIRDKLPKTIIYIDINDFVEWFRPKAKSYVKAKRILRIVDIIAREFQKRFVGTCNNKNRGMATCPDCGLCPYFGEDIFYEATPMFQDMAFKFVFFCDYPIVSDDFKLSNINPSEIDKFYYDFFTSVNKPKNYF